MNIPTLDTFTRAYIECALWSSVVSTNAEEEGYDEPLDKNHSIEDIAPETLAKMIADCQKFQAENDATFIPNRLDSKDPWRLAGHDFWLTRNGHGAGFWDGDWEEDAGKALTAASKAYGEFNLYIGDDGKIYA